MNVMETYCEPGGQWIIRLMKSSRGYYHVTKLNLDDGDLSATEETEDLAFARATYEKSCEFAKVEA